MNSEQIKLLSEMGIEHLRTTPYTPEQNRCAERKMRTIVESARTMKNPTQLRPEFWVEAVNFATYNLNRIGTSTVENQTPYELYLLKSIIFKVLVYQSLFTYRRKRGKHLMPSQLIAFLLVMI